MQILVYFDQLPLSFLTLWPLGTPLRAFGCQYQQNMETVPLSYHTASVRQKGDTSDFGTTP